MSETIEPGSAIDLALEEALRAASLRAGGANSAVVAEQPEPSAAEAGDLDGADGD